MGKSAFRGMVSCVLMFLFPGSLFAADSDAAMLHINTNGAAWVNGAHVPRSSSAIFSGDLLQTRSDSVANINEPGASITILSDSLVQFQGASVDIQHGGVTVSTSKGTAATAGDVKVTPKSNVWTEFRVIDTDGTVRIHAEKGDLVIDDGSKVLTLAQGQHFAAVVDDEVTLFRMDPHGSIGVDHPELRPDIRFRSHLHIPRSGARPFRGRSGHRRHV